MLTIGNIIFPIYLKDITIFDQYCTLKNTTDSSTHSNSVDVNSPNAEVQGMHVLVIQSYWSLWP